MTVANTQKTQEKKSYQDWIVDAIITLKEKQGSSRQAIWKYLLAKNSNLEYNLFIVRLKKLKENCVITQSKGRYKLHIDFKKKLLQKLKKDNSGQKTLKSKATMKKDKVAKKKIISPTKKAAEKAKASKKQIQKKKEKKAKQSAKQMEKTQGSQKTQQKLKTKKVHNEKKAKLNKVKNSRKQTASPVKAKISPIEGKDSKIQPTRSEVTKISNSLKKKLPKGTSGITGKKFSKLDADKPKKKAQTQNVADKPPKMEMKAKNVPEKKKPQSKMIKKTAKTSGKPQKNK